MQVHHIEKVMKPWCMVSHDTEHQKKRGLKPLSKGSILAVYTHNLLNSSPEPLPQAVPHKSYN